ncbi:glycosyltransferase family 4 protein [Paenibacillus piri]|uniref:Glycosyltransferase family 1 protein n=1 Tax=Paenibacillus piri TaxID=2547395 RepID=A0A4R5KSN3_9BACL|nr:glycosyltransferase family 1 protein [Paenibacillus piri]TDF98025.1 glycosyltransferase family 1 protein [Paenibacillus piri]
MRIALFSDTYWPQVNGVAMTLKRLTEHLERRNVSYRLFVPRCSEDELYTNKVQRFSSLPFLFYPECRIALPNYMSISNELQQFQPDLIHVATPFNIGLCGLYYGRKYDIAHVASYHTHFDRYLSYYHLQFASPLLWRYIRWFHQSCLATFVPSQETAEQLAGEGIRGLELWKRGVDCNLFHPGKKNTAIREKYKIKERFILLYVGRIAPEKDLDLMPDIMRSLPESLRDHVHWIFAGDGPLLKHLQETAPPNATFTGYMKGEALAELYASADLFVFPSSTETFGNVVLESLASGTPAIGAASGGVQEIIQHGRTGMLCPTRDTAAFVHSIASLLEQPGTLRDYGLAGRAYALTQSWEAIFDNLLLQYEQILHSVASRGKPFSA